MCTCVCVVCPLVHPRKGPRGRLVCFYVVCPLVNPENGPRGRLICLLVVCPLVHPEKGPRGRLICLLVVCPLVHPEKGPRGRLVRPLCSLSPGTGVPGEGLFCLHVASLLVFLKRLQERLVSGFCCICMGQVNAQELAFKLYLS